MDPPSHTDLLLVLKDNSLDIVCHLHAKKSTFFLEFFFGIEEM